MDILARKAELEALIKAEREAYYNGTPIVTDEVFDSHLSELEEIDELSDMVRAVGAPPPAASEWPKVKHGIPMGSLDKVNEPEEMAEWIQTFAEGEALLVTEKLDGISIHLKYVGGRFVKAITRGDGYTGEDITKNVAQMKGVPARLTQKFTGSIRGEIVLLKSDHQAWFPSYSNPRNGASGISKRYDGKGCEHLTVFVYKVVEGQDLATEQEQFQFLASLGLIQPNWRVYQPTEPESKSPHNIWVEYQQSKRAKLDYEIDGLVVNINDLTKQLALGEKDLRPLGSIAFKFPAIALETESRACTWQTGSTGRMTPVAGFDAVNLLGAQVTQASLYNYKYISDLGFDIGAKILVARANDVIPRVISVVKSTGTVLPPPDKCETCGTAPVRDGEYYVCPNHRACHAQVVGRLSAWIKELKVLDFGSGLIEKLVQAGKVTSVPDLYRLSVEDIAGLDRLGEKTAIKVLANLREKSPLPLDLFLGALSIPGVATSTIRTIMDAGFDTLDGIKALALNPLPAGKKGATGLASIKGIGSVKAGSIATWFRSNQDLLDDLASVVPIRAPIRGRLSGKSICFTGASKKPRAELEALVVQHGGVVKGSVTKNLTYLVLADANLATTKAQAAKKNGTECLSEEQFLAIFEG